MLGRSCFLVPFGGLVPEVVRFKIGKAILLVILLIVALSSCGQWFLASRTFSNTPAVHSVEGHWVWHPSF